MNYHTLPVIKELTDLYNLSQGGLWERWKELPEDEQEHSGATSRGASSIIDSIKRKTEVTQRDDPSEGVSVGKVRANVESTKLREILNNMGDNEE
jgi:hypothetical protein